MFDQAICNKNVTFKRYPTNDNKEISLMIPII